ncbi:MAG TPA: OmpA family protein [Bryobacteraceae bacterium]|nr:OmpA family protein [Bryobacteraceae bacterium]
MRKFLPTRIGATNSVQDPVVAPAGIGLRAGSTQRPLLDVAGPGIDHQVQLEGHLSKGESKTMMKTNLTMAGALLLSLMGAGCVATHKYVAKTISPVESRVTATEQKNTDQDKQLADHSKDIDSLTTDLSRTKERVTDADAKAVAAGQAAQRAGERADNAQRSADGAQRAADGTRTFAERGLQREDQRADVIEKNMVAMNKYQMAKSVTVLFAINQSKLTDEGKAELDELAKATDGKDRYVIEVQGFTDKTGSALANEQLSQARAAVVSRYLVNEHKIPVRTVTTLGSGYALPVADDKTREGRKQNRRMEVRLFVPETIQPSNTIATAQE